MRGLVLRQCLALMISQWLSAAAIRNRQQSALVRTMRHAVTNVPYYRALGIGAAGLRAIGDLQLFPILTKPLLRARKGELLADGFEARRLHWSRTSGSSGEPSVTYFDDRSWALCRYALKMRRMMAMTSPLFRRVLLVSDRPANGSAETRRELPFEAGLFYRERVVSLHDEIDEHPGIIDAFRPDLIHAYPSYLLELMRAYRRRGRAPPKVPWLCTSSELLRPGIRERIEKAFNGRVFDVYGCTEFKEVAWQCREGAYHVNVESVFVEILHDEQADGAGQIVLTTLCNRAMPLLRYVTGDRGALLSGRCRCGRNSPQLRLSAGRESEAIPLPSGRRVSPYLLELDELETMPGLYQYQIVHDAPDRLRVDLLCEQEPDPAELDSFRVRMASVLGEPMKIEFRRVHEIRRPLHGKHAIYQRTWSAD